MSHAITRGIVDLPPPLARPAPRPSRGDGWNTLADIEVFIFAVEAELEAMDRERVGVHRRGRKPDLSLRRRLIGVIWMLTFGGMQRRIAGWLSGVPFTTLHTSFARWSRLGLWRRLGQRLALEWRLARGDEVLPSAGLAALGFQGDLLGDSGFKGEPFAAAALDHDIHVAVSPGGTRDGRFLPNGIRWVVERLFAWLSRYRRLNIVYDREPDLFAAHIWIAMISIISRRLVAQTQAQ